MVIAAGALFFNGAHFVPFVPANTGTFGEYGVSGIFRGAAVIFFAYIGFDAVSTSAQEAKDPQRDMPVGIIGSLLVCTVLYVLVSGAMIGLVPYEEMRGQAAPLVVAVESAERSAAGTMWAAPMAGAPRPGHARRPGRADLGDAGDDDGAAAHLPGDVA